MLKAEVPPPEQEEHDVFDSYFECITECYWIGGEDIECVRRCVEVHLKDEE